jgi:hypothetical protein
MTSDAKLCLQKTWPLIELLVMEIGLMVSLLKPLARQSACTRSLGAVPLKHPAALAHA